MSTRKNVLTAFFAAVLATGLAACGGGSDTMPAPDLGPAQMAAATAATDAGAAADAAEAAVAAQAGNQAADVASYTRAQDAAARARAAANAAAAAAQDAQNATTLADAEAARDRAQAALSDAADEQGKAEMHAGMVADAQKVLDDAQDAADAEAQRVLDVDAERNAAMTSSTAADTDATMAEEAAGAAEAASPGSPGAMAARAAATAARTAATAAKAAHDAIMDDMSKADADAKAAEAATAAGTANGQYMTAKGELEDILTSIATGEERDRQEGVATATGAADKAAKDARQFATDARKSANSAREAANDAKADYERAVASRTDMENAKKQYEAAEAAATAAEAAATAAENAATAAENAHQGIDPAGSVEDAQLAQMTAEEQRTTAMTAKETAANQVPAADTAAMAAATFADTHVLGLFKAANPADDPDTPPEGTKDNPATADVDESKVPNENADRVKAVTTVLMAAAAADHKGSQPGGTSVTVTYNRGAAEDDPKTPADETAAKREFVAETAGGGSIDTKDFQGDDPTATMMDLVSLGAFTGVELEKSQESNESNASNTYVHIYTDIEPQKITATPRATQQLAAPTGSLDLAKIGTVSQGSGSSFTGTYEMPLDHDNNPVTAEEDTPIPGTFSCSGNNCTYTISEGKFTAIGSGFTFAPDPVTIGGAPILADGDGDYLTFGVWLDVPDATGVSNGKVSIGAFSDGEMAYTLDAALTGTATYEGPAVGVKSMGGAVSHVDGTATLTADFGKPGEDDADDIMMGTVSGMLVRLGEGGALGSDGSFSGIASSGDAIDNEDATVSYPYNGAWGGSFYGASDDGDTKEPQIIMPSSAAGTFGVTGGEKDAAMSLIGAFGVHKQ